MRYVKLLSLSMAATVVLCMSSSGTFADEGLRNTPIVKVVREWSGSVVNISTEKVVNVQMNPVLQQYNNFFGNVANDAMMPPIGTMKLKGLGSGVIVSKDGLIVTNAHVINMASNVYVMLSDGAHFPAENVAIDNKNDLALIKISANRELKPVEFADDVMIGETVVSIGNPFGLENSVSSGVISGARRKFLNGATVVMDDLLQTDAAVNEGSSGGALLNLEGKLVGINLAIIQNAQNVGFAIVSGKVRNIIKEYDNYKKQKKTITIPIQ